MHVLNSKYDQSMMFVSIVANSDVSHLYEVDTIFTRNQFAFAMLVANAIAHHSATTPCYTNRISHNFDFSFCSITTFVTYLS